MSFRVSRLARFLPVVIAALLLSACQPGDDPILPDTAAPSVEISAPEAGSFAVGEITVTGTARDNRQVTGLTYQLNGGAAQSVGITPGESVSFSFTVPGLAAGENTIVLRASDAAGNQGSAQVRLTRDVEMPVLQITSLPEGTTLAVVEAVPFAGSVQDDGRVTRLTYQVNGGAEQEVAITGGSRVSFDFPVPMQMGQNAVTVTAYDGVGNRAQLQRTVERQPAGTARIELRSHGAGTPVTAAQLTLALGEQAATPTAVRGGGGFPVASSSSTLWISGVSFTVIQSSPGVYEIRGPAGFPLAITIAADGYMTVTYDGVVLTPEQLAVLDPQNLIAQAGADRGSYSGGVRDSGTGVGIPGVALSLSRTTGAPFTATATTGADGLFVFSVLPSGSYRVEASRSGYASGSWTTEIFPERTIRAIRFLDPVSSAYRIIDLGGLAPGGTTSYAFAINDAGEVAGQAWANSGRGQAFIWSQAEGMRALPTLGGDTGWAWGLNRRGDVVGWSYEAGSGVWRATFWRAGGGAERLPVDPRYSAASPSLAAAINQRGEIVGAGPNSTSMYYNALMWVDGVRRDLPGGILYAVNDASQAVGAGLVYLNLGPGGPAPALLRVPSSARTGEARSINNPTPGIAGSYEMRTDTTVRAVFWPNRDADPVEIGWLPGGQKSRAYGVNNAGQVVGASTIANGSERAFLWQNGNLADLTASSPRTPAGCFSVRWGSTTRGGSPATAPSAAGRAGSCSFPPRSDHSFRGTPAGSRPPIHTHHDPPCRTQPCSARASSR